MIRRLGLGDAPAMARAHAGAMDRPWTAQTLAELLRADEVAAFGCGALEGFVLVRLAADEAEILTLAVAPEARRRGRARALLKAAQAHAAAGGARRLVLEVAEDNAPARALYAAAGFGPVGRRRGYYDRAAGAAADALVLAKDLAPAAPPPPPGRLNLSPH